MADFRYIKRLLLGRPLRSSEVEHQKLGKIKALAVMASDALSSTAYATEEILLILALAGSSALYYSLPVSLAIIILIAVVVTSYRQAIIAYPSGGGAYVVASENLGRFPGLITGASLLIDYTLTVAVSLSAGVAAITSAFPELFDYRVPIALGFLALLTLLNLRGAQESATIFAIPTYLFVGSLFVLIGVGIAEKVAGPGPLVTPPSPIPATTGISLFLILRAFSSGSAALTGVEAISDAVQAFKEPRAINATKTLAAMAIILILIFGGLGVLAYLYGITPEHRETVVSQLGRSIFGESWVYYAIQATTALILVMAANTSFTGFPSLASIMAKDKFLPRQLASRGDRLVFTNSMLVLALFSGTLLVLFHGNTSALIPLYAVGVFLSFTLSQMGLVRFWRRERKPGWRRSVAINGFGAVITGIVTLVFAVTKFTSGAWMVIVLIPLVVVVLLKIRNHYDRVAEQLRIPDLGDAKLNQLIRPFKHEVIVPVSGVSRTVINTLEYARSVSDHVKAVYIALYPDDEERIKQTWEKLHTDIELTVIPSPYRSLFRPLLGFIHHRYEKLAEEDPRARVTVMVPEFVLTRWWHYLLHNETAFRLKAALLFEKGIVVCSVPFHLSA